MPTEVGKKRDPQQVAQPVGQPVGQAGRGEHVVLLKELAAYDGATDWGSTAMWATAFFDAWGHDLGLGKGLLALRETEVTIEGVDYRVADVLRAQHDTVSVKGKRIDAGQFVAILSPRERP